MSPYRRNIVVGLVVLTSLGVLAWMSLKFASQSFAALFTKGTNVVVIADRADGLADGSAVVYLGVNVGRVQVLRLNPTGTGVIMDVVIDEGRFVPQNVHGVIRAGGLLGGTSLIALETAQPPAAESIKAGTQLTATNAGNGFIPPEFTKLADEINSRQLVHHLDQTIVAFRTSTEKVGKLLDSTNELIGDKQMRDDLRLSLANIRSASERADKLAAEMNKLTGGLNDTTKKLNDRIDQVGTTLTRLDNVVARVDKGEGTAGLLVNDPRLYESLADTAKELSLMVADLKRLVQQWEQEGISFKLAK